MTPEQCRAARAVLGWTLDNTAQHAACSRRTLVYFEQGADARTSTHNRLVEAFAKAGVIVGAEGRSLSWEIKPIQDNVPPIPPL